MRDSIILRAIILGLFFWLINPPSRAMASIGPFGGSIFTIALDPSHSEIIYAGTLGGRRL